jgi:hypothetical protein
VHGEQRRDLALLRFAPSSSNERLTPRAAHRPTQQSFLVAGTWKDALEEALK